MNIRLFGIVRNRLDSWTSDVFSAVESYVAKFNGGVDFIAFEIDVDSYATSVSERVERIFSAFGRGDWVGDRDDAVDAYNKWATYNAYPVYTRDKSPLQKIAATPVGPRKPAPKLPAEVWTKEKFDAEAAWKAIQDLSKGS